jgi:hypothetical protein
MPLDPALGAALRPFERRAMLVTFVQTFAAAAIASTLAIEIAMFLGVRNAFFATGLVAVSAAGSAAFALRRRPSALVLARRIDARARLNDLIVTSVSCGGDGMPSVVRRAGISALVRESTGSIFPLEAPRHWRRWLGAIAVVQLVAVPLAFRAPASRAPQSALTSLTLPASGGSSSARPSSQSDKSAAPAAAQTPQSNGAAAASEIDAAHIVRDAPQTGVAKPAVADNGGRLKIATANAGADIAAGRVPLARRTIVEKYFAALQAQKERHR